MKKSVILMMMMLCLRVLPAAADNYGTAVIDSGNGSKVHLREEPSADSDSLGLFFTGTQVEMRTDPAEAWTRVRIDGAGGYIRSDYLSRGEEGDRVKEEFWRGVIDAKNYVNFRRGPSTEYNLVGRIDAGEEVDILGETEDGWYYVRYNGDTGYVSRNLIDVVGQRTKLICNTRMPQTPRDTPEPVWDDAIFGGGVFPDDTPQDWAHMSGAGAWSTRLHLEADGSFSGYYRDSEGSVVYESAFRGRFSNIRVRDRYAYTAEVAELEIDGTVGRAYADRGILHITKEPAGIAQGELFVLCLPRMLKSRIEQEALSWLWDDQGDELDSFFLYSLKTGRGFMPETDFR